VRARLELPELWATLISSPDVDDWPTASYSQWTRADKGVQLSLVAVVLGGRPVL